MARASEYVRVKPFMDFVNGLWDKYEAETEGAGNGSRGPGIQVCADIGWPTSEAGVRRLYRYRRGLTDTKRGGRAGASVSVAAIGFDRATVEEALFHAGEDFYEFYPEFAHERSGPPEPEAWCPACADHVMVVTKTWKVRAGRRGWDTREALVCAWCDWKMTDGHLNGLEKAA